MTDRDAQARQAAVDAVARMLYGWQSSGRLWELEPPEVRGLYVVKATALMQAAAEAIEATYAEVGEP